MTKIYSHRKIRLKWSTWCALALHLTDLSSSLSCVVPWQPILRVVAPRVPARKTWDACSCQSRTNGKRRDIVPETSDRLVNAKLSKFSFEPFSKFELVRTEVSTPGTSKYMPSHCNRPILREIQSVKCFALANVLGGSSVRSQKKLAFSNCWFRLSEQLWLKKRYGAFRWFIATAPLT